MLILAVFSLVGWLYLTQASVVTATSYRIDELRVELDQLKNQNAALTMEIAELEALPRIESRARELGFAPTTNIRYLPVSNYPVIVQEAWAGGVTPEQNEVEKYMANLEPAPWWMETLDNLAAWLEGK